MVKGVNKTIIEVNQTGSRYFERVLLFVSPAYGQADSGRLAAEADRLLRQLDRTHLRRPPLRLLAARRRKRRRLLLLGGALLLAVAALCGLAFLLF